MKTLELTSWKKGLQTVSLIRSVKELSKNPSVADAKAAIERLLDGETVKLEFENESKKEEFKVKAESLGAICS
jgi:hypothetical protein